MLKCWDKEPLNRPSFNEISSLIGDMLTQDRKEVNTISWTVFSMYKLDVRNTDVIKISINEYHMG